MHPLVSVLIALVRYFACLSRGRIVLWCYLIWYAVNVWNHFDPNPRLWLTSLGLSAVVGFALILSAVPTTGESDWLDRWLAFRLFLIPFCVSSFAALVRDSGYILVFPRTARENLAGLAAIAIFLIFIWLLKHIVSGKKC